MKKLTTEELVTRARVSSLCQSRMQSRVIEAARSGIERVLSKRRRVTIGRRRGMPAREPGSHDWHGPISRLIDRLIRG